MSPSFALHCGEVGRRVLGPRPMRQDDPSSTVCGRRIQQLLRSRRPPSASVVSPSQISLYVRSKDWWCSMMVQRRRNCSPCCACLPDRKPLPARFLILVVPPRLAAAVLRNPCGRIETIRSKVAPGRRRRSRQDRLWLRGGFSLDLHGPSEVNSVSWRHNSFRRSGARYSSVGHQHSSRGSETILGNAGAHHGQIWNVLSWPSACRQRVNRPALLGPIAGVFMLRQLQPWFENLGKRQVKTRKSMCATVDCFTRSSESTSTILRVHPKIGASWEGLAVEEVLKALKSR